MQTNAVPATLLPHSRERQDLPPAATCCHLPVVKLLRIWRWTTAGVVAEEPNGRGEDHVLVGQNEVLELGRVAHVVPPAERLKRAGTTRRGAGLFQRSSPLGIFLLVILPGIRIFGDTGMRRATRGGTRNRTKNQPNRRIHRLVP